MFSNKKPDLSTTCDATTAKRCIFSVLSFQITMEKATTSTNYFNTLLTINRSSMTVKTKRYYEPDQQRHWRNYLLGRIRQHRGNVSNKSIADGNTC